MLTRPEIAEAMQVIVDRMRRRSSANELDSKALSELAELLRGTPANDVAATSRAELDQTVGGWLVDEGKI